MELIVFGSKILNMFQGFVNKMTVIMKFSATARTLAASHGQITDLEYDDFLVCSRAFQVNRIVVSHEGKGNIDFAYIYITGRVCPGNLIAQEGFLLFFSRIRLVVMVADNLFRVETVMRSNCRS
jgi:hypothetical protein